MAIIPLNIGTVGGGEGSAAITVIDTPDEHGGTIREIIAVDISKDTVSASTLLKGITAHDRYGDPVTGTHECSGTPTLQSKTATPSEITQYVTADSEYDGLSDVTVNPIPSSYVIPTGTKNISSNGTHSVSGFASASVLVSPNLQTKSTTPTTSSQEITPDSSYDGLSKVTVGAIPSQYIIPTGSKSISSNGTYDVTSFASAVVNVSGGGSPTLQTKTVTPTESEQTVTADSGYDGLSSVTVEAIDDEYIGSGVTQRDSTDLTASGATVTAPAGYYEEAATKTIASGSATTPATTVTANPSISVNSTTGVITATASATKSVTPTVGAGYVSSGTAGTITVSGSNTSQLSTVSAATITPTTSSQTAVAAGKYTLGAITVGAIPSQYIVPTGTKSITANGTGIDVTSYAAVDVAVPSGAPNLQDVTKSYTPSETAQSETITAGSGYDGLGEVEVNVGAISSTYVGSGITRRSSTNLSVSGATVTAPAGYYEEAASKSVASGSATTPATTVTANPSISVNSTTGVITATASATKSVTPTVSAGYVSSGTAGTITVSGSNTSQLSVQAAATITPSSSQQTAVAAGKYTTGAVVVAAIPSSYVQPTDTQGATTYNVSSSNQTIASGTYLTGTQTIRAVTYSGLSAGNIASGVTVMIGDSADADRIVSVTGTLSFATYYTGSGTPSSSQGSNGDIYLKTS